MSRGTTRPLSETQERVLDYLRGCGHASQRRIYQETGATTASLQALAARGLIEPYRQASYRITDEGDERQAGRGS